MTLAPGGDGQLRCAWCVGRAAYEHYHDHEWGFPVVNDQHLFEKISLEAFQSGLSWWTILQKREHFRAAFAQFDFVQVARFNQADVVRLLQDAGIVRHRGKIEAVIHNAARAVEMVAQEGSLATFFWRFAPQPRPQQGAPFAVLAQTPQSQAMAKALKQRHWKFVGPTTCYAFMQSMGMVNDHAPGCRSHLAAQQAQQAVQRPV